MGQTVAKRILKSLSNLIRTKNPLDDLKEHISIDEKRRAVRIYIDYPIDIEFPCIDYGIGIYKGESINLSESGILFSIKIESDTWKKMKLEIEDCPLIYHFRMPNELIGDRIEGKVRRFVEKKGKENGEVELEFGVQNETEGHVDKLNLLDYINNQLMDSINKDIDYIEEIMKKRDLTPAENKIYRTLISDYSDRS
jgi:hypothetical protein